ncbi:MAG: hypothetical protein ACXABY_34375, partial [Candidatus Thorarchaeota archaeon]
VGGTDWSNEQFDTYISHIFPEYARSCENFVPKPLFAIRGKDLLIYATCVAELSAVFVSIREVWG